MKDKKINVVVRKKLSIQATPKKQTLSLLPGDYGNLIGLPKINGVELNGDMNAQTLSLLSSNADDYPTEELDAGSTEGKFFVVLDINNTPVKVPAKNMSEAIGGIKTTDSVDEGAAVGSFQFVEK